MWIVSYPPENRQIFAEQKIEPFIPEGTVVEKTYLKIDAPHLIGIRLLEDLPCGFVAGEILPASEELLKWKPDNLHTDSTLSPTVPQG